jgi:preprotein translocase subunit SecD
MKQRKLTPRAILVAVVLLISCYYLFPTYRYEVLRKREEGSATRLAELTGLSYSFIIENLYKDETILRDKLSSIKGMNTTDSLAAVSQLDMLQGSLRDKAMSARKKAIKRGLDLQGGMHLVLEVDLVQLLRNISRQRDARLEHILADVNQTISVDPQADFNEVLKNRFESEGLRLSQYFGEAGESDATVTSYLSKQADDAINRSLEILRNRIDQFGVSEPTIQKEGSRRIVLELPGIQDPGRARDLIGRTALLEFKLAADPEKTQQVLKQIDEVVARRQHADTTATLAATPSASAGTASTDTTGAVDLSEALTGGGESKAADTTATPLEETATPFTSLLRGIRGDIGVPRENVRRVKTLLSDPAVAQTVPEGLQFVWSAKPEPAADGKEYQLLYFVKSNAELIGTALSDARVDISGGTSNPAAAGQSVVSLELNRDGARKFARVTGANVNKRLAIVLDDRIYMAPVIRSKIPNGRAVIEGLANIEEANDLAIVLRAGALPTSVLIEEERTVGPSLGRDSIRKGLTSTVIGALFIIMFMAIYYRGSGMIANLALLMNFFLTLAGLALFGAIGIGATLSLPGIAGLALSVGMAVDANVLIFERIREELETGKTVWHAIATGYDRAFVTILDANLTTIIACVVLLQFGTGPVKGFAVTLCIGLVSNLFTAVFVTRIIFDWMTSRKALTTLSI